MHMYNTKRNILEQAKIIKQIYGVLLNHFLELCFFMINITAMRCLYDSFQINSGFWIEML